MRLARFRDFTPHHPIFVFATHALVPTSMPLLSAQRMAILCTLIALFLCVISALHAGSITRTLWRSKNSAYKTNLLLSDNLCHDTPDILKTTFGETIAQLYRPIILDVKAKTYTDAEQNTFDNGGNKHWQRRLGKEVLILDIDTRIPDGHNQIFNPERMDWGNLEMEEKGGGGLLTVSFLNHFLYSQIHGYDYKFFHASKIDGHYDTWIKPHIIYNLLHQYKFVIFIDADAIIQHLEVPMEFLFNRWGITPNTSIGMPIDTRQVLGEDRMASMDSKGRVTVNTGVVIAQALPHTFELLNAWRTCTSDRRYPGCAQWKEQWSHEQRAFSEYIRYDYNKDGNNIIEFSCDDANGYPGLKQDHPHIIDDCRGLFIRHLTIDKSWAKTNVNDVIMQTLAEIMQKTFRDNKEEFFINEASQI